jgi:hypothetical protein
VDFRAAKYVMVPSTCHPYKQIYKRKWRFPDVKTSNNVHHIKIDNRKASSIMDMKSCRGANSHPDHFLWVKESIDLKQHTEHMKYVSATKKFNVGRLREYSMITFYQQQLGK